MTTHNPARPAARAELPPQTQPGPAGTAGPASRLAWLDVLRGLAALCVVSNHFGYFVPQRLNNPVNQWVNPGDYGVFVFFLISGYIVPASLERKGSVRTFWVSKVAAHRSTGTRPAASAPVSRPASKRQVLRMPGRAAGKTENGCGVLSGPRPLGPAPVPASHGPSARPEDVG